MLKIISSSLALMCSLICISVAGFTTDAFAQWSTQKIDLRPGWNAIFLEVQPEPNECDAVFKGLPVESVWFWNWRFSSVQFIQDAFTLVPEQPEWLTYFRPYSGKSFLNDLYSIQGGRAYLIELGGSENVTWEVTGKAVVRSIDWRADSFNLVGFNVDPNSPPTFEAYFAPSESHSGKPIYRLNSSGKWEKVINPAVESIQPGESYWVFCEGQSNYSGQIAVTLEQGGGIDFGRILTEQTLRVRNETPASKQIILKKRASKNPPDSSLPALSGEVLLTYWIPQEFRWIDLPDSLALNIESGKEIGIRLGVKRSAMPGALGALYQSLLEISDGDGSLLQLPVTARGMASYGDDTSTPLAITAANTPHIRAGLWVGNAVIAKTSYASDDFDWETPRATASEFQFRLIVHVDHLGQAKLLRNAILLWKEGTLKPDPDDPTRMVVDEPGRYVLLTREDLIAQFSGAAIRDGRSVGRRISSAAFGFSEPLSMTGSFDGTLRCDGITIDYDHPLNPFKHKYHPDHDNLDPDHKVRLVEGKESYTVVRNIVLAFTADDPENLALSGWGDNQVGGTYRESIIGIHKRLLNVEGIFRLHHISRVAVLNDGL